MSRRLVLASAFFLLALGGLAAAASAQTPTVPLTAPVTPAPATTTATTTAGNDSAQHDSAAAKPQKAKIKVHLKGVKHGRINAGDRLLAIGRVKPYVPHQVVHLRVGTKGHAVKVRKFHVTEIGHTGVGRFHVKTPKLYKPGPYRVSALHVATDKQDRAFDVTRPVGIHYPNLNPGDSGDDVKLFTFLLRKQGYYVSHTSSYNSGVGLAVLAFRKVNKMSRTTNATPGIFRTLAKGKGTFKLKYPNAGRHVEVDISRQVMALADHGKAQYIFHVSTGAPATPTITGHYTFYRQDPGYNSEGMYYSSYWHNGYAVHGYASVPTYNASHGCVRTPIPDATFIYGWIQIGESIYTYN
jgi:lipoprotein-anchoring transpeptidase ErfK/SrfK